MAVFCYLQNRAVYHLFFWGDVGLSGGGLYFFVKPRYAEDARDFIGKGF